MNKSTMPKSILSLSVFRIRQKYGFSAIVHAHSLLEGGRAIARSSLVGGHAGGHAGIEGEGYASNKKRISRLQ